MAELPDPLLQTFLAGRDFRCPVCRYNLRGLQADFCPECGTLLRLQVGAVEPDQTYCILGLIGLAVGAGFSALLTVFIILAMTFRDERRLPGNFVTVVVLPMLVESALIIIWLKTWIRLRRLPMATSLPLALGCWGLSLL